MKLSLANPFHALQFDRLTEDTLRYPRTSSAGSREAKSSPQKGRRDPSFFFLTAIVVFYAAWGAAMMTTLPASGLEIFSLPAP